MELYLMNITVLKKGKFQLVLDGDNAAANDGEWKALGGGGAFLGQFRGYWTFRRMNSSRGKAQDIFLREGDDPNIISWLWRRDFQTLGFLDLPDGLPYLGDDVFLLDPGLSGNGTILGDAGPMLDLEWNVVHRFF